MQLAKGTIVECNCVECSEFFVWTAKENNETPSNYCSKACSRRGQKRRKSGVVSPCPRPDKYSYLTIEQAQAVARRTARDDHTLRGYHCVCGWYHLGRRWYTVLFRASEEDHVNERRRSAVLRELLHRNVPSGDAAPAIPNRPLRIPA